MSTPDQAWKSDPDYDRTHARRFDLSLEALKPFLHSGALVLSLGSPGSFERTLVERQLVDRVVSHSGDLRSDFGKNPEDGRIDIVLCMEVFEHIHDREASPFATEWRATGTRNLLSETYRSLKPGGILFLTTPNACSLNVLDKVMTMQAPMVYRPHVREYAPAELVELLTAAGFRIESCVTHDCWGGGCSGLRRRELEAMLARAACPSPHRGEDIFIIARKP